VSSRIVDVHAHLMPSRYVTAVGQATRWTPFGPAGDPQLPFSDTDEHLAARISDMDQARVDIQVMSLGTTPHYLEDEATSARLAALCNDEHAAFASRRPDRLRWLVTLPLPHADASVREARRGLDDLDGGVGVTIACSILDRSPADEAFWPLYEELDRRDGVVFFHPTINGLCSPLVNDFGLAGSVGTSLEDSMAALHLVVKAVPATFPRIRWIVPHVGGVLAMLLNRLDRQGTRLPVELPEPMSTTLRRFYYDTVAHGSQPALQAAWRAFGPTQLLPGSDYPILKMFESYTRTFAWIEDADLPERDVDAILFRNAQALLGL
jgi:predicted TIM-barrel fold metal-dependent hydrolase